MLIEALTLSHKTLLEPLIKKCSLGLSEYSFANLYLFRSKHAYQVVRIDGSKVGIQGVSYDGMKYFMPLFIPENIQTVFQVASQDCFFPIPEKWLLLFSKEYFVVTYKEDDSDYLYEKEKLSTYPGRHLSKKRNLVHQFLDNYAHTSMPLSVTTTDKALEALEIWEKNSGNEESDFNECSEAIKLYETLGLEGVIYYIDNRPAGLLLGEGLTHDTFVIHFAKADIQYKGIYQFMYQDFAKNYLGNYAYVNMEQDLGEKTLRQTKHSYQPEYLYKKYRVFPASSM